MTTQSLNLPKIRDAQDREHQAWLKMFEELSKVSGFTKEQLNKPEWKDFFISVEKWGFTEYERRIILKDNKESGCLWIGEGSA